MQHNKDKPTGKWYHQRLQQIKTENVSDKIKALQE